MALRNAAKLSVLNVPVLTIPLINPLITGLTTLDDVVEVVVAVAVATAVVVDAVAKGPNAVLRPFQAAVSAVGFAPPVKVWAKVLTLVWNPLTDVVVIVGLIGQEFVPKRAKLAFKADNAVTSRVLSTPLE